MTKLSQLILEDNVVEIEFVETQSICEGVTCDVYKFKNDVTRDLAIVEVKRGFRTPRQQVLHGEKTIEGFIEGEGMLTVDAENFIFSSGTNDKECEVRIGQTMQWHANGKTDLIFYEICSPPYESGRFKELR